MVCVAVTGSVDQFGNIQAVGGVNEKIEGFFDLCSRRGLTGSQGVIIPEICVMDLMLAPRVISAIAAGSFAIYPITTIDEGFEFLTGCYMGQRDSKGRWSRDSANEAIQDSLDRLHKLSSESGD